MAGANPFLDGIELSALSGLSRRSAFRQLRRLAESGHIASVLHATPHIPRTRRHYLTRRGVRQLALELGVEPEDALLSHPLSAQWQRILVRRLDAVAFIYRLASSLAILAPPDANRPNLRWYRRGAWDAAVLMDGSVIAILLMGQTADRNAFGRRLWSLDRMRQPAAALIISHDEPERRNLALKLRGRPIAAFIATERDVGLDAPNLSTWRAPRLADSLSLAQVVGTIERGGSAPPSSPTRLNRPSRPDPQSEAPLSLVPRSSKSALAALSDWPLKRQEQLAQLLGVRRRQFYFIREQLLKNRLVLALQLPNAEGRRLALSDTGIRALAYRDRSDVATVLRHWSAAPAGKRVARGAKLRQLARAIEYTDAVHNFLARLVAEARATRGATLVAITPQGRPLLPVRGQDSRHTSRRRGRSQAGTRTAAVHTRMGAQSQASLEGRGQARPLPTLLQRRQPRRRLWVRPRHPRRLRRRGRLDAVPATRGRRAPRKSRPRPIPYYPRRRAVGDWRSRAFLAKSTRPGAATHDAERRGRESR